MKELYIRHNLTEDFTTWAKVFFYDKETDKYYDSITVRKTPGMKTELMLEKAVNLYKETHPNVNIEV